MESTTVSLLKPPQGRKRGLEERWKVAGPTQTLRSMRSLCGGDEGLRNGPLDCNETITQTNGITGGQNAHVDRRYVKGVPSANKTRSHTSNSSSNVQNPYGQAPSQFQQISHWEPYYRHPEFQSTRSIPNHGIMAAPAWRLHPRATRDDLRAQDCPTLLR